MLNVANKSFIQSVIMLSVIMLYVVMLSVVMLNVVMLSVFILNVDILSVVMLNVVAPSPNLTCCQSTGINFKTVSVVQNKSQSKVIKHLLASLCTVFYRV